MTMVVGSAIIGAGTFVACDTRITQFDGGADDVGGKVFSTGGGWATGGGAWCPFEDSMAALKAAGPVPFHYDPENPAEYWHAVAIRAEAVAFAGLTLGGPRDWPRNSLLVIEPHTPVIFLKYRTAEIEMAGLVGDGPKDLGKDWPSIFSEMLESVVEAGNDLAARIRAVAAHFESAAIRSYDMSNVMEVGYLTPDLRKGFLRGKARDIANARVEDLLERFDALPLEGNPIEVASRASRGGRFYLGQSAEFEFMELNTTGNVLRGFPMDDAGYAGHAVDAGGDQLHGNVVQQSGGGGKNIAVGRYSISTGTHTQSVSFPSNYQNPPAINILGGISYEPASVWGTVAQADAGGTGTSAPTAARQIDEVAAYNVTTSGCSLRARLRQAGSSTNRSDAYASGAITTNGGTKEATTANAPANNDSYTSDYTYDFENHGIAGKTGSISATVCLDYWNGSSWIQVASATYSDTDDDGDGDVVISGSDTLTAVVSGLTSSSKFRIRLVVNANSGGGTRSYSVDPGNCTYTTTSGDQYATKTPAGFGITLSVEVIGAS